MGDVTQIDEHRPHEFFEAMCVKCLNRWAAVVPVSVLLVELECRYCGTGYVIRTGQPIEDDG